MQSKDLDEKMNRIIKKMPFVKAIILIDMIGDAEVFRYQADDIDFKSKLDPHFFVGLRGGMNELYRDFKNQFAKLGECNNLTMAVMYDQYFVKKA